MDQMGNIPGPTLEQGIEQVYNEVRKTHNGFAGTKEIVVEICNQEYFKAPDGISQYGYKGSFGSIMGWVGCNECGAKDRLVNKVIRRLD